MNSCNDEHIATMYHYNFIIRNDALFQFAKYVIIVLSMLSLVCFKMAYPKNGNSHFTEKWFAIFGTSDKMQSNCKQSPKRGFLF